MKRYSKKIMAVILDRRAVSPVNFISSLKSWHLAIPAVYLALMSAGQAMTSAPSHASVVAVLARWTPFLLGGFLFNVMISLATMVLGTVIGLGVGLALISVKRPIRWTAWVFTEFFRNAPWLVLLFFVTYLLPFEFRVGGAVISFPGWIKAVIALALPVAANVAEIVRGAVQSIHPGQWEAAESLSFTRRQQLFSIILPQCIKRMLPPWMNLYAILTMSTTLASIVGVGEVLTLTGEVQAAEGGRTDLLIPLYSYILLMFLLYSYPLAKCTQWLERRHAI